METIPLASIEIPNGRRPVSGEAVNLLVRSFETVGLRTPVTVRAIGDNRFRLVAGAHRIEAAYRLGWQTIAAYVLAEDDENPEHAANEDCLWEIAENLHRAELSADQRGEHFARWLQLRGEIPPSKDDVLAAWEKAEPRDEVGGVRAAARELDASRHTYSDDKLSQL